MEFDGILDEIRENKKVILIILGLIVAIVIVSIFNLMFNKKETQVNVEDTLEAFAELYYEDIHYVEARSLFGDNYINRLKIDEEDGIKLTLRSIVQIFEDVDTKNFFQEGNYCSFTDTYAIIYPKQPYGKSDYKIETNVSCEESLN